VRGQKLSSRRDKLDIHPVIGVEWHKQSSPIREDEVAQPILLASPISVPWPRWLDRPFCLHERHASIGRKSPWTIMTSNENTEILVGLGGERGPSERKQGLY
jgi:hypothetical protein